MQEQPPVLPPNWPESIKTPLPTTFTVYALFSSEETFNRLFETENARLYDGSYRAQWISGTIQPAMRVVANLNFVVIAVVGGVKITSGTMTLGDVQAFSLDRKSVV